MNTEIASYLDEFFKKKNLIALVSFSGVTYWNYSVCLVIKNSPMKCYYIHKTALKDFTLLANPSTYEYLE